MNLIQEEMKYALDHFDYDTFEFEGHTLVKLTEKNAAIAEMSMRYNNAYRRSFDKQAGPDPEGTYRGSSAFWMVRLRNKLIDNTKSEYSYDEIIEHAVISVDIENSTHLNADKCGRREIKNRLLGMINSNKDRFLYDLKSPKETGFELYWNLAEKTAPTEINPKTGEIYNGRKNFSFASKFCHYACYYMFAGEKEQDNYPISDDILKTIVPFYQRYLKTESHDLASYDEYVYEIDDIRLAASKMYRVLLSRNAIDHLLWYFHKKSTTISRNILNQYR